MEKLKRQFWVFIILILSSSHAFADFMDNPGDFAEGFAKNWEFECNIDLPDDRDGQKFVQFYQQEAQEAVRKGLNDLRRINWDLMEMVVARTYGKKLSWGCDFYSPMNKVASAYFNPFLMGRALRLGLDAGQAGVNCLYGRRSCTQFRQMLLHEFYHFAGLDNNGYIEHNKNHRQLLFKSETSLTDVIYSCAAQSYPHRDQILEIRKDTSAYSNSIRICNICAAAKPGPGRWGTKLDTSQVDAVIPTPACQDISEEKHLVGWVTRKDNQVIIESAELRRQTARLAEIQANYERELKEIMSRNEVYTTTIKKKQPAR